MKRKVQYDYDLLLDCIKGMMEKHPDAPINELYIKLKTEYPSVFHNIKKKRVKSIREDVLDREYHRFVKDVDPE